MGHSYIERLPRTQQWQDIVALIGGGATAGQVARAVLDAVRDLINPFAKDQGVIEATWYLIRLPLAARDEGFPAALRRMGLGVGDASLSNSIGATGSTTPERISSGPSASSTQRQRASTCSSVRDERRSPERIPMENGAIQDGHSLCRPHLREGPGRRAGNRRGDDPSHRLLSGGWGIQTRRLAGAGQEHSVESSATQSAPRTVQR